MSRATKPGANTYGPMAVLAYIVGAGIGLALVAPILPSTVDLEIQAILRAGGAVILAGMAAFAGLLVVLAILYQVYLKA